MNFIYHDYRINLEDVDDIIILYDLFNIFLIFSHYYLKILNRQIFDDL